MKNYLKLLETILIYGDSRGDRTGTGTKSLFGEQLRFDLNAGFPLITTKKLQLKNIVHELLWVLKGDTNNKYLEENDVKIWSEWALEDGSLGPIYGEQYIRWNGEINQIEELIKGIKEKPFSRRHLITSWNPSDLPDETISPQENVENGKMCLASCQSFTHFYVSSDNKLSCLFYMRSSDTFKGLPHNIAYWALFTMMVAQQCDLELGTLIYTAGDCHLYSNHVGPATTQLGREPRELPKLNILRKPDSIFDYQVSDFELVGYDPHPYIKSEIAV